MDKDPHKDLIDMLNRKNKSLDEWWQYRSRLGQRVFPYFTNVKIAVKRKPREANAIVGLNESVAANMTPRNPKRTVEHNIVLAREIDMTKLAIKRLQDDGGERE